LPPRVSFRHVYFSFDKRGAQAREAAGSAVKQLAQSPAAQAGVGDPFMFQDTYADRTPDQIAKEFGPAFAQALFRLAPGTWQGPVESGYGWHAIVVTEATPARVPPFEEIEPEVKSDWVVEQGELAKQRVYESMRARYEVILPELPTAKANP
jgi:parvulin-like peptidyl-prolyl isomerase